MKILVTGATGFIGNYVIEFLLNSGHSVIASSTSIEKAKSKTWFKKVEFIPYTISNTVAENLFLKFKEPDIIIHLAWEGLPDFLNPVHYEKTLLNQYIFIKNLVLNGAKHIAITGTCLEYGMKEGCLNEDMICNPDSSYGLAKDTLRKFLKELQKIQHYTLQWIRLFYMYGEGQYEKAIIPQLKKAIANDDTIFNMSGGEQLRDYLSIEQIAENICSIALQNKITDIINCCKGEPVSIKKLVEDYLSSKQIKMKLNLGYYPYPTYEPMEFWGDNTKLKLIQDAAKS